MTFAFKCSACQHTFDESYVEVRFDDRVSHRPMRRSDADHAQACPACGAPEGRYDEAGNLVGSNVQFKRDELDVTAEETGADIYCKVAGDGRRRSTGAGVRRFIMGAEGRIGGWDARWV